MVASSWLASNRKTTAATLGIFAFVVYLTNLRPMGAADSIPARLLPFSVLREGNLDLDEFAYVRRMDLPGFLVESTSGRLYSKYPIATPLLITPWAVPAVSWLRTSNIPDSDVRFRLATLIVERLGAASLAALSVAVLFLAVWEIATPPIALGIALAYAFSTNVWAVASQAAWQHALAALSLAGTSLFFLRPDTPRNALAAGGFAALGVAARPTMLLFALPALAFALRWRRSHILHFLFFPAIIGAALLAYNFSVSATPSGGYHKARIFTPRLDALAGLLVSPSRGLFIYTPAVALAFLSRIPSNPWLRHVAVGVGCYWLLYGSFHTWWGGHSYGPRFFVDTLPAFALCSVSAVERLWRAASGRALLLILTAWGLGVQIIGVYFDDNEWNVRPGAIGSTTRRLWDWHDPQILRAARAGWHGTDLAPLLFQAFANPVATSIEPMSGEALQGKIEIEAANALAARPGDELTLDLRVTNDGVAWPVFSDFGFLQVQILYTWSSGGAVLQDVAGLVDLPRNIAAGGFDRFPIRIKTPSRQGVYELGLTVVQVRRLENGMAGASLSVPVTITNTASPG